MKHQTNANLKKGDSEKEQRLENGHGADEQRSPGLPLVQPVCPQRHVKGSDETVRHRSPIEVQQFTWFSASSWRREKGKTGIAPATRPHTRVQPRRANSKRGGLNNEMHMKYERGRGIVADSSPAADANTLKRRLAHLAACLACFHA